MNRADNGQAMKVAGNSKQVISHPTAGRTVQTCCVSLRGQGGCETVPQVRVWARGNVVRSRQGAAWMARRMAAPLGHIFLCQAGWHCWE